MAFSRLEIAIALALLNFLTLPWGTPVKDLVKHGNDAAGGTQDASGA